MRVLVDKGTVTLKVLKRFAVCFQHNDHRSGDVFQRCNCTSSKRVLECNVTVIVLRILCILKRLVRCVLECHVRQGSLLSIVTDR